MSTPFSFSLSAIMFAYNEAAHLEEVIRRTLAVLEAQLNDYELIIIDDGSRDATPEVLKRLSQELPALRVVTHTQNRGIGEAVHTGYSHARKAYVCILPADGQVTLSEYVKLFPRVAAGADLVLARYRQRGEVDGLFRMVLSRGLRLMMLGVLGVNRQIDGVFIFRRSLLERFPLTTRSFFVNLELPIRGLRAGIWVEEVEIEVFPRISGKSKVVRVDRIKQVAGDVARLRVQLWKERMGLVPERMGSTPAP